MCRLHVAGHQIAVWTPIHPPHHRSDDFGTPATEAVPDNGVTFARPLWFTKCIPMHPLLQSQGQFECSFSRLCSTALVSEEEIPNCREITELVSNPPVSESSSPLPPTESLEGPLRSFSFLKPRMCKWKRLLAAWECWAKRSTVSIHLSLHLRSEGAAVMSRWDEKKKTLNMHGNLVLCPWDHWRENRLCAILRLRDNKLYADCNRQLKAPSVSKLLLNVRQDRRGGKKLGVWEGERSCSFWIPVEAFANSGIQVQAHETWNYRVFLVLFCFFRNITRNPNFRERACTNPPYKILMASGFTLLYHNSI